MKKILKLEDLLKLSSVLNNETMREYDYDLSNMTMTFSVDETTLRKVNEEIFFSNNNTGTPEDVDEIVINVNNVHFKYVLEEEEE